MTPIEEICYEALLKHTEGGQITYVNGSVWETVYIDNARPKDLSPRAWAGYLSRLKDKGLYKKIDGHFGEVKLKWTK